MDLIIVESPTKAKTLSRFLGSEYQIEASYGHIRDLPKSTLGIDTEHDFSPHYIVPVKAKKRAKELGELAKKAKKIILATDPDREGEAIAWHVSKIIQEKHEKKEKQEKKVIKKSPVPLTSLVRIVFHEITENAIKEALQNPRNIDMQLVDSQQARRILDRLVGYKLSPLLWNKVRRGLSAGRVQSVAVRMIVEREREIQAFKSENYWEIEAWLNKTQDLEPRTKDNNEKGIFKAKLVQINNEKAEIKSEEQANKIKDDLLKSDYSVKNVEIKNVNRYPYPPFNTSTMTQAAANLFGWPAKKTMMFAQRLFEEGFITYHRTDSFNLAMAAISETRDFIKGNYGDNYLPELPKFYKTKSKVAQEAHEAIRPTQIKSIIDYELRIKEEIGRDAWMLYQLIWKRMVACQIKEAVYERTAVDIQAQKLHNEQAAASDLCNYLLKANGSKLLFDGWLRVYGNNGNGGFEGDEGKQVLPKLVMEEPLKLKEIDPIEVLAKQTEPPPRFNEASLIKTLEEYGIGRPSTYAPIISTIQDRLYVEKIERKFQPTSLGFAVCDFLIKYFPEILDYKFTAGMEDNLDKIANGEIQWVPVIKEFYTPFAVKLEAVYENAERVKIEVEQTEEKCPQCGANLVIRMGRFGKFLACSKFPQCKFTKSFTQTTNFKCPKCGGDVIIKMTKRRRKFYGCANYPKCDFASWKKPIVTSEEETPRGITPNFKSN